MEAILRERLRAWMGIAAGHAWMVLALVALSVAAAGWYTATNLGIDTRTSNMIPADAPFRVAEKAYWAVFPQNDDNIVIVIQDQDALQADRTATLLALALDQENPYFSDIYAPGVGSYFKRNGLLYLSPEELASTIDRLAEAQAGLATVARDPSLRGLFDALDLAIDAAAKGEPMPPAFVTIMQRLADAVRQVNAGQKPSGSLIPGVLDDGKLSTRVIQAKLRLEHTKAIASEAGIEWFRDLVKQERGSGQIADSTTVRLTGEKVLSYEELESVKQGMTIAGIVSLLLLVLILGWGLRSVRLIVAAYVTLFVGMIWMGAFATATVGSLNMLSVSVTVLYIGLGIDHAIHFCLRYAEALSRHDDRKAALQEAGAEVGPALMLCALTTVIGFLSFIPTDYRGFADLGIIAAGGMLMSLLASLIVLPALLAVLGTPGRTAWRAPRLQVPVRLRSGAAIGLIVLGVLALLEARDAHFDSSTIALKDPNSEGVQTLEDLTAEGGNTGFTANLVVSGPAEARAMAEKLEQLPEVDWVMIPADFVPADQDEKLAMIDEAAFFLWPVLNPEAVPAPDANELNQSARAFVDKAKQAQGLPAETETVLIDLAGGMAKLIDGPDATARLQQLQQAAIPGVEAQIARLREAMQAGPVTFEDLPKSLLSRDIAASGQWSLTIYPKGDMSHHREMKAFADALTAVTPGVSGRPISEVATGRIVVTSFELASGIALSLIILVLFVVLRRVTDVVFVLIPLFLAFSLTVAVTVLTGMAFNFANVIVLPLLLGFGVDSGIHMVLRNREQGAVDAMMGSSTPRAIVLSALTTIASFVSLSLSSHWGTASLGILLTLAMSLIVLSTVTVLPALLRWRDGANAPGRTV